MRLSTLKLSIIYRKLFHIVYMPLYIFLYHLIRHITTTHTKISPRPYMPTPILLPHLLELPQKYIRTLPLQLLYQSTNRYLRWYRYHQVHMIPTYMPLYDLYPLPLANLPYDLPHPIRYRSPQNRSPIFRYPYYVQMDLVYAMAPVAIPLPHALILSCSSFRLKGEGFNPPQVRQ